MKWFFSLFIGFPISSLSGLLSVHTLFRFTGSCTSPPTSIPFNTLCNSITSCKLWISWTALCAIVFFSSVLHSYHPPLPSKHYLVSVFLYGLFMCYFCKSCTTLFSGILSLCVLSFQICSILLQPLLFCGGCCEEEAEEFGSMCKCVSMAR